MLSTLRTPGRKAIAWDRLKPRPPAVGYKNNTPESRPLLSNQNSAMSHFGLNVQEASRPFYAQPATKAAGPISTHGSLMDAVNLTIKTWEAKHTKAEC
jgi:hypothetical protein